MNRLNRSNNFNLTNFNLVCGEYNMPQINRQFFQPPQMLVGFNYALSHQRNPSKYGVHFYIHDYQFERVWTRPTRYVNLLRRFACVLSPDFSLFTNMPLAMQIWNVYRSRLLGQYWQNNGVKVIPTVSWSYERSYEFCFDGLPVNSIISVSTRGCVRQPDYRQLWQVGMAEAVRRLKPAIILVYGSKIDFDPKGAEVIWIPPRKIQTSKIKPPNSPTMYDERTEYIINHPELVSLYARKFGVAEQDIDDLFQKTVLASLEHKKPFDPTKSSIKTWASNFVRYSVRIFAQKPNREIPTGDLDYLPDENSQEDNL